MIIDVTGTVLIPGNNGADCPDNGNSPDVECCCDECDYMLCCFSAEDALQCSSCNDHNCPHSCVGK